MAFFVVSPCERASGRRHDLDSWRRNCPSFAWARTGKLPIQLPPKSTMSEPLGSIETDMDGDRTRNMQLPASDVLPSQKQLIQSGRAELASSWRVASESSSAVVDRTSLRRTSGEHTIEMILSSMILRKRASQNRLIYIVPNRPDRAAPVGNFLSLQEARPS